MSVNWQKHRYFYEKILCKERQVSGINKKWEAPVVLPIVAWPFYVFKFTSKVRSGLSSHPRIMLPLLSNEAQSFTLKRRGFSWIVQMTMNLSPLHISQSSNQNWYVNFLEASFNWFSLSIRKFQYCNTT